MYQKLNALLALTFAMVLLGSSFVAGKSIVMAIPIPVALAVRLALSTTIMLPLLMRREGGLPRLSRRCWSLLGLEALIGVVASNYLVFHAYDYVGAASVGIVFSVLPVVVAVMSAVFLVERIPISAILAIVLASYAIASLNQQGASFQWTEAAMTIGLLLSFGAVVCEGAFTVFGKKLAHELSPLATAALVSLISLIMVMPLAALEVQDFDPAYVTMVDWLALLWWAIASGVGYFWLWFVGVARVDAHAAGMVTVALPLSTLLLSSLVLEETISTGHLIAAGCAVAAVLIISGPPLQLLRKTPSLFFDKSHADRLLSR